jgi:hypothetical protein
MDVLAAIGNGGAAGLVGTAFGLGASALGAPGLVAAGVGGVVGYGVKTELEGGQLSGGDALFAGVASAVTGGVASKAVPINAGWFKPNLRTPRSSWKDFGPYGQTLVRQEAVDGFMDEGIGMGYDNLTEKKCGCK